MMTMCAHTKWLIPSGTIHITGHLSEIYIVEMIEVLTLSAFEVRSTECTFLLYFTQSCYNFILRLWPVTPQPPHTQVGCLCYLCYPKLLLLLRLVVLCCQAQRHRSVSWRGDFRSQGIVVLPGNLWWYFIRKLKHIFWYMFPVTAFFFWELQSLVYNHGKRINCVILSLKGIVTLNFFIITFCHERWNFFTFIST